MCVCAVVADYVPRALQVPARVGVVGLSGVMFMGLLKLSLMGPGIGGKKVFKMFKCTAWSNGIRWAASLS